MLQQILKTALEYILDFREWTADWLEPSLPLLKLVSAIISAIFIWGIFYTIFGSNYLTRKAEEYMDIFLIGDVGKRRQIRIWKRILGALKRDNSASWKKSVLDADTVFDEIIKMSGYRGQTVHDRFKQLRPETLTNYNELLDAHRVRDRVRQEPDFALSKDEASRVIKIYEKAFMELGLLD